VSGRAFARPLSFDFRAETENTMVVPGIICQNARAFAKKASKTHVSGINAQVTI
jgi:hypothetical protein